MLILFLFFLALNNNRGLTNQNGNEGLARLNEYAPIALFENVIVYNYFEGTSLVFGRYCINEDDKIVVGIIDNFHISFSLPVLIDDNLFMPITLNNGEHSLIRMNLTENSIESIHIGYYTRALASITTTLGNIYYLGWDTKDGLHSSYIKKFDEIENKMDTFLIKNFDERMNTGEIIEAFSSYRGKIYAVVRSREGENEEITIHVYDAKDGVFLYEIYLSYEFKSYISSSSIAQFYIFGDNIYVRNFSDYGVIGRIENKSVELIYTKNLLRIAINSADTDDDFIIFFMREDAGVYMLNTLNGEILSGDLPLGDYLSIRSAISDGANLLVAILDDNNMYSFVTVDTKLFEYSYLLDLVS